MAESFRSRRFWLRAATALVAVALVTPHAWAWWKLHSAKGALARHHPEEARRKLDSCERVWGGRVSVRLAACRASWQMSEFTAAASELREAQRILGGATDETAFEWALLQAAAGEVRVVDRYLQRRAEQSLERGRVVWEALAMGYLSVYRTLDAMAILNHWLELEPNNVRALELRGQTYVVGKGVVRGAEDYRRVLALDATRHATRRRLAQAALDLGRYPEAAEHLELLARDAPDDPWIAASRARAYLFTQRLDEARRLLDEAIEKHPDDPLCLRIRGHHAILVGRPAEAEGDLRRAVAIAPWEYQAQNLLFQALQQQGKTAEAKEQLAVAERVRDHSERLGELQSRQLAQFPLDANLHCEMGALLIDTGRGEVGVQWLRTALTLDPTHKAAQERLAAYLKSRE
jgi:tetratricopeptide (TPR) repeat protein